MSLFFPEMPYKGTFHPGRPHTAKNIVRLRTDIPVNTCLQPLENGWYTITRYGDSELGFPKAAIAFLRETRDIPE